jgi:glutathione S-transferase
MKPYRLFSRDQTGGMAIEAALDEAGVPYDLVDVPSPATSEQKAEFAGINPRLQVPVLIHPDGTVITEGPAILHHLGDAFPDAGLVPIPGSSARASHDRWLSFFHANVYEGMLRELAPARYTTDAASAPAVQSAATDYIRRHFLIFETELGEGPYLSGSTLSMFDIYLWMLCFWMDPDWLAANCKNTHRLWSTARNRPALARIAQKHFG